MDIVTTCVMCQCVFPEMACNVKQGFCGMCQCVLLTKCNGKMRTLCIMALCVCKYSGKWKTLCDVSMCSTDTVQLDMVTLCNVTMYISSNETIGIVV